MRRKFIFAIVAGGNVALIDVSSIEIAVDENDTQCYAGPNRWISVGDDCTTAGYCINAPARLVHAALLRLEDYSMYSKNLYIADISDGKTCKMMTIEQFIAKHMEDL